MPQHACGVGLLEERLERLRELGEGRTLGHILIEQQNRADAVGLEERVIAGSDDRGRIVSLEHGKADEVERRL